MPRVPQPVVSSVPTIFHDGFFSVVHVVLQDIIESYDIKPLDHLTTSCIRNGRVASRVEQTGVFPHGSGNAGALDGIFYTPFLIAVAPENH